MKNKSLKEFRLSQNQLEDKGGNKIAEALLANRLSPIRSLHLSDNKLSAEIADKFSELINEMSGSQLKDLDLSNNLFIMDELTTLAEAFKQSNLDLLNLRGNIISAEEVLAFDSMLATVANMPRRKFLF